MLEFRHYVLSTYDKLQWVQIISYTQKAVFNKIDWWHGALNCKSGYWRFIHSLKMSLWLMPWVENSLMSCRTWNWRQILPWRWRGHCFGVLIWHMTCQCLITISESSAHSVTSSLALGKTTASKASLTSDLVPWSSWLNQNGQIIYCQFWKVLIVIMLFTWNFSQTVTYFFWSPLNDSLSS